MSYTGTINVSLEKIFGAKYRYQFRLHRDVQMSVTSPDLSKQYAFKLNDHFTVGVSSFNVEYKGCKIEYNDTTINNIQYAQQIGDDWYIYLPPSTSVATIDEIQISVKPESLDNDIYGILVNFETIATLVQLDGHHTVADLLSLWQINDIPTFLTQMQQVREGINNSLSILYNLPNASSIVQSLETILDTIVSILENNSNGDINGLTSFLESLDNNEINMLHDYFTSNSLEDRKPEDLLLLFENTEDNVANMISKLTSVKSEIDDAVTIVDQNNDLVDLSNSLNTLISSNPISYEQLENTINNELNVEQVAHIYDYLKLYDYDHSIDNPVDLNDANVDFLLLKKHDLEKSMDNIVGCCQNNILVKTANVIKGIDELVQGSPIGNLDNLSDEQKASFHEYFTINPFNIDDSVCRIELATLFSSATVVPNDIPTLLGMLRKSKFDLTNLYNQVVGLNMCPELVYNIQNMCSGIEKIDNQENEPTSVNELIDLLNPEEICSMHKYYTENSLEQSVTTTNDSLLYQFRQSTELNVPEETEVEHLLLSIGFIKDDIANVLRLMDDVPNTESLKALFLDIDDAVTTILNQAPTDIASLISTIVLLNYEQIFAFANFLYLNSILDCTIHGVVHIIDGIYNGKINSMYNNNKMSDIVADIDTKIGLLSSPDDDMEIERLNKIKYVLVQIAMTPENQVASFSDQEELPDINLQTFVANNFGMNELCYVANYIINETSLLA